MNQKNGLALNDADDLDKTQTLYITKAKWIKHLQSLSPSFFISYYTLDTADPNGMQNTRQR